MWDLDDSPPSQTLARFGRCAADTDEHIAPLTLAAADDLPTINGLEARIVVGTEFWLRDWFQTASGWTYHCAGTATRLGVGRPLLPFTDPKLRRLHDLAINAGFGVTTSCEGHFFPRAHFEMMWQQLQRESDAVRKSGLRVRDCDDQTEYVWQDSRFRLPWNDFGTFHAQASAAQASGFIGIAIPADRMQLIESLRSTAMNESGLARWAIDEPLTELFGQPVLCATVHPRTADERDAAWARITGYFEEAMLTEVSACLQTA